MLNAELTGLWTVLGLWREWWILEFECDFYRTGIRTSIKVCFFVSFYMFCFGIAIMRPIEMTTFYYGHGKSQVMWRKWLWSSSSSLHWIISSAVDLWIMTNDHGSKNSTQCRISLDFMISHLHLSWCAQCTGCSPLTTWCNICVYDIFTICFIAFILGIWNCHRFFWNEWENACFDSHVWS